jgi:hypothetical protein
VEQQRSQSIHNQSQGADAQMSQQVSDGYFEDGYAGDIGGFRRTEAQWKAVE